MGASPLFLMPPDKKTSAAELPDRMRMGSQPELRGLIFFVPQVGRVPLRSIGLSLFGGKLFGLRPHRSEDGGRWLLWLSLAGRSRKAFICSLKRFICSACCWITAFCWASNACCWMSSSRCASCSRRTFFFARHALTLLALAPFGKSPADLGCSLEFTKTACNNPPLEWFLWQSIVVLLTIRNKCAGLRAKSNYISSHLPRLRRKIEDDPSKPVHILTEPGTGYYLVK